jgi:2-polyprenyl-6-methoxyphenol hydroxylase-like FAD-dependent oxidoreductase
LKRPHDKAARLQVQIGDQSVTFADFTFLPPERAFIALMPQWDFLDFLAGQAKRYPGFHLIMQANVTGLIEDGGRVTGVRATTPDGPLDVRARLTVGCDGRKSTVRDKAGLEVEDIGAPIDVLWMRISRVPGDPGFGGRIAPGSFFAVLDRGNYFQLAYVIAKGDAERIMQTGLPAFRQMVAKALPFLASRVDELKTWDDIKLLTVSIDRLRKWYKPGLLCIGDVGINLAIQDAVATANLLWRPLKNGTLTEADLARVQRRREFPTRVTQGLQVQAQKRAIQPVLRSTQPLAPPWFLQLFNRLPLLQRIPARIVGVGVRPEHVHTPEASRAL